MSEMKTLIINGVWYTAKDGNAVSFCEKQNRTDKEKEQARENIGATAIHIGTEPPTDSNVTLWVDTDEESADGSSTITVTIDEEGMASHTAAEIYAHVQSGGGVRLLYSGSYYASVRVDEGTAWFCYNSDDGFAYSICIVGENPIEEYEHYIPNEDSINQMIDEKLGVIENGSY